MYNSSDRVIHHLTLITSVPFGWLTLYHGILCVLYFLTLTPFCLFKKELTVFCPLRCQKNQDFDQVFSSVESKMKCTKDILAKLFGTFIVLISLGLFIRQAMTCFMKYLDKETTTTLQIVRYFNLKPKNS